MTDKQQQACDKLDAMMQLLREIDQTHIARSLVVRLERTSGVCIGDTEFPVCGTALPLAASGWSSAFRAEAWQR